MMVDNVHDSAVLSRHAGLMLSEKSCHMMSYDVIFYVMIVSGLFAYVSSLLPIHLCF